MASRSSCGWWATSEPAPADLTGLAEHFFRTEYGRVTGAITRWLGPSHLDLAEDAVQDALAAAVRTWPLRGVPRDPTAWLVRAARNAALDHIRRSERFAAKATVLAAEAAVASRGAATGGAGDGGGDGDSLVQVDDQLALMLLCCDPALRRPEQVALTLKAVAGFGTDEIARAFLVPVPTMAQRIVRAKRRLRDQAIAPLDADAADGRVPAVLDVVYLIFNEGYSHGPGPDHGVRVNVADEAVRLAEMLTAHPLGHRPDAHALAALVLLQSSRLAARIDGTGAAVALRDQDRTRWDRARIDRGLAHLAAAGHGDRLSDIHLLAGIAACHAVAPTTEATDWGRIAGLYDELAARSGSPLVRLNRAVAVGMAQGPDAGLRLLEEPGLDAVPAHLRAAARGDCLERLGRAVDALAAWREAAAAAPSEPERLAFSREVARLAPAAAP